MALPEIKFLVGGPLANPYQPFYAALFSGSVGGVTTSQFVVDSGAGDFVVFSGNFTVSGDDVIGGTVTGFDVFAGSTNTLKASGFSFEAGSFFDAVQGFGMDTAPFFDLLESQALKIVGSKLDDYLGGTLSDDVLIGKAGNDRFFGWDGNDTLKGGKGNDLLAGAEGFDVLKGGDGTDAFAFAFDLDLPPPVSFDRIKDFKHGEDYISLDVYSMGGAILPPGFLTNKYFHKGAAATTADEHVIYDKKTGKLFFDADGSGAAAQVQFAKVKAGTHLSADDFYSGSSIIE